MFAQLRIKNKIIKNILITLLIVILIPLLGVLIEVIKTYGIVVGSNARYIISTKILP